MKSPEHSKPSAPVVSVIIPTYKHRDLVMETLASVEAQTFRDFEIIVIDDGSPDGTAGLLRPLAGEGRIQLVEQPNAGQATARNKGISIARGEFIALLDDDDLWPIDKLQWQLDALRANPRAVLCYGYSQTFGDGASGVYPDADAPRGDAHDAFTRRNWIISPGQTLVRSDVLRSIGGFDCRVWGADDWDLHIRLAARGDFVYQHRLALMYRVHPNNASKNARRMYLNSRRVMHKHLGRTPRLETLGAWLEANAFMRRNYFEKCVLLAHGAHARGDWKSARRHWSKALSLQPQEMRDRDALKRVLMAWSNGRFPPRRAGKEK